MFDIRIVNGEVMIKPCFTCNTQLDLSSTIKVHIAFSGLKGGHSIACNEKVQDLQGQ